MYILHWWQVLDILILSNAGCEGLQVEELWSLDSSSFENLK